MIKGKKNITLYSITGLIILSFLLRGASSYFLGDVDFDNEWNILIDNLINYKSYSFYTFNSVLIPSVYMPPLYPFSIFFIKIITSFEKQNLLYSVIIFQIVLSVYSVYLFYQINENFFSKKISLINSAVYSIVPLNIYAAGQISSITLQIFLSLFFLKILFLIMKEQSTKYSYIFHNYWFVNFD